MEQSRVTLLKIFKEINSNYQIAKKADENVTNGLRTITKEILLHSFEIEKSEITTDQEEGGNAVRASFILFNKRKKQKRIRKIKDFVKKKKKDEKNLWKEWNMIKNKLKSLDAESLFEIIKVNRQYGFSGVSRHILEN